MRILLVVSRLEAGIGRLVFNLARAMSASQQVTICELYKESEWGWHRKAREYGVEVVSLGRQGRYDLSTLPRLLQLTLQLRPDVVNGFDKTSSIHAALAATLTRGPVRVTSVNGMISGFRSWWQYGQKMTFHLSDGVIACSTPLQAKCLQQAPFIKEHLVRIYNGIPVSEYTIRDQSPARQSQADSPWYAGSVGALYDPVKGLEYALRAVQVARAEGKDIRLKVIGEGPLRPAMEALSAKLGISQVVEFTGWVPNIEEYLLQTDAFVLPSLSEGLPTALLEAMAMGLPAIASGVGGVPEVVQDRISGYLVPAGDVQALAQAMLLMEADRAATSRMGQAGRLRVEKLFAIEKSAQEYISFYTSLLARKTARERLRVSH
jgi:glycosyltransferase involved in cell wall biosynthesis